LVWFVFVDFGRPIFTHGQTVTIVLGIVLITAVKTGKGQEDTVAVVCRFGSEPYASYAVHRIQ
jgi:hypothetical protein